jgi:hypothetical protein
MLDGPVIVLVCALIMIGWIVHVIVDGIRRRQQLKVFTDFHSKLLERLERWEAERRVHSGATPVSPLRTRN